MWTTLNRKRWSWDTILSMTDTLNTHDQMQFIDIILSTSQCLIAFFIVNWSNVGCTRDFIFQMLPNYILLIVTSSKCGGFYINIGQMRLINMILSIGCSKRIRHIIECIFNEILITFSIITVQSMRDDLIIHYNSLLHNPNYQYVGSHIHNSTTSYPTLCLICAE